MDGWNLAGLSKGIHTALGRTGNLVVLLVFTTLFFFFTGQWLVSQGIPEILELRERTLQDIQDLFFLKPLRGLLAPYLSLKILYTFLFNLIFGAFLSTTIPGIIFFLPYMTAISRSLLVGILFYGVDRDPITALIFYGTFFFEFGGYCFSSAVGMDLGLSLLFPGRKGKTSRKEAVMVSLRDGMMLYVLVVIFLFIGAVWEMSWLHFVGFPEGLVRGD